MNEIYIPRYTYADGFNSTASKNLGFFLTEEEAKKACIRKAKRLIPRAETGFNYVIDCYEVGKDISKETLISCLPFGSQSSMEDMHYNQKLIEEKINKTNFNIYGNLYSYKKIKEEA